MEEKGTGPSKATAGAALQKADETRPRLEAGAKVDYVRDKPYSAGEAPEVVEATVTRVHGDGVVDLELQDGGGPVEKTHRAYSERHEPGTWHWRPRG